MDIENTFSNGRYSIECQTVGDVIDELSRLPRDLPVKQGLEESVDLVVVNLKHADTHLIFEEGGEFSGDDYDDEYPPY